MHLTTLFPAVRPRGWLELRAIDAPERAWWGVPPTLLAALLYDDLALAEVLDVLRPLGDGVAGLMRVAAREGIRNDELRIAADAAFEIALQAAERFPDGYFEPRMLTACEQFREKYIATGTMQADDRLPGVWDG